MASRAERGDRFPRLWTGPCWLVCALASTGLSMPLSARQTSLSGPAAQPVAAERLRQATDDLKGDHLPEAQALLDSLRATDGSAPGLWATYALLDVRKGEPSQAVVDFQKELSLHPHALGVYGPLVAVLVQLGRRPEALAALRAWCAAAPGDGHAAGLLVGLLLDGGDAAAAVQAGDEAVARLPVAAREDPQLQYALGGAELKAGAEAAGAKRLLALLATTPDDSARNSIAYALGDAGAELPAAEATERDVLSRLELQSEGWTADSGPAPFDTGTPLLAACWDTLGWILFHEGKPAEAEPYVRAAYRNRPNAVLEQHLREVEAGTGHRASGAAFHADFAQLRTFALGPAAGRSGSARFRLLLAHGRLVAARRDPGGDLRGPDPAPLLAHASFAVLFPAADAYLQVAHRGKLSCSPAGCIFVIDP